MDWLTLLLMAVGLSADAFAVAIGNGIICRKATVKRVCRVAGAFGIAQGVMPLIGYGLASLFAKQIVAIDHWVAFGLLAFLGGKMIFDVVRGEEEEHGDPDDTKTLLMMAIATSIDAMAVGVSMAMSRTGLLASDYGFLLCAAVIAVVTFTVCTFGVMLGCKTGAKFGDKAMIGGGVILIGIGLKILIEHLMG